MTTVPVDPHRENSIEQFLDDHGLSWLFVPDLDVSLVTVVDEIWPRPEAPAPTDREEPKLSAFQCDVEGCEAIHA